MTQSSFYGNAVSSYLICFQTARSRANSGVVYFKSCPYLECGVHNMQVTHLSPE